MRGIERNHGICRQTVSAWLLKKKQSSSIHWGDADAIGPEQTPVLELDELCSFVFSKRQPKVWVWIALEQRDPGSRKAMVFTDYWEAYQAVIPNQENFPVGKETGKTSQVERWNNTLRQHLARFVYKMLSWWWWSKWLEGRLGRYAAR